jgi:hypothetical protein
MALPIKNAHDPVIAVHLVSLWDDSSAWFELKFALTPERGYRAIVHPSLIRVVPHRPTERKPDTPDQVPKTNWIMGTVKLLELAVRHLHETRHANDDTHYAIPGPSNSVTTIFSVSRS